MAILYHMSTLFFCKNNFSKIADSGKNGLPNDAERSNFRLIKHREIEHNIVSCLNVFDGEEMGM